MGHFKDISLKIEREKEENQTIVSKLSIEEEDALGNINAEKALEIKEYLLR